MSSSIQVDVFLYSGITNLGPMNPDQISDEAKNIVDNMRRFSTLFRTFPVVPALFEQYNIQYSEKQVTRIDDNFFYYSRGTRIRLLHPPSSQGLPRGIRYLIRKSFSGDVSGDIGEALLTYFVIQEMGVNPSSLGHTKPIRKKGFPTPDFIIEDTGFHLSSLLQTSTYPLPVLAEAKGFTGSVNPATVACALGQLKALGSNPSLFGLAFLAVRNERRRGYDAYIVRVRV